MAYEIEQRFEHIGTEILEASRNALYINMRYLDVALSGLAWEMTTDISRIGTDGLRLLYEPHYLADLYRKHPMLVNRVYPLGASPPEIFIHFSSDLRTDPLNLDN